MMRASWPSRRNSLDRPATTSPSPPVFAYGAHSEAIRQIRSRGGSPDRRDLAPALGERGRGFEGARLFCLRWRSATAAATARDGLGRRRGGRSVASGGRWVRPFALPPFRR